MKPSEAKTLLATAMPADAGSSWADFGAGDGTFSRALIELLGDDALVYAVDRDPTSLASMNRWPPAIRDHVIPVVADLGRPLDLPGLGSKLLDGALIANTLHFFRDTRRVLATLVTRVKPRGRVVIIEYDRRGPNPWVPFPIPRAELDALVAAAGLSAPSITAIRPSRFGGDLYVAATDRVMQDADAIPGS